MLIFSHKSRFAFTDENNVINDVVIQIFGRIRDQEIAMSKTNID